MTHTRSSFRQPHVSTCSVNSAFSGGKLARPVRRMAIASVSKAVMLSVWAGPASQEVQQRTNSCTGGGGVSWTLTKEGLSLKKRRGLVTLVLVLRRQ